MTLSQLTPGQKFKLPAPNQQTVFTVQSHCPGNPNSLTDATCEAPNQRIDDREYAAGEGRAIHVFGSHLEVEVVE